MKVAGFIANRIAFNREKSFSRFIIRLSIVATVISVAVMVITLVFAEGFQETVSQKVFSFWGHIHVQEKQPFKALIAEETPIELNDTVEREIRQHPQVTSIHPFATRYALIKTVDEMEGVMVKGLDTSYDFNHINRFIIAGRPIHFNDSTYSREIMLSAYTASQLKLKVGDRILIFFIRPENTKSENRFRPDKLTLVGIFKTGIEEYDHTFAIGDIKLIRRLNDWQPNQAGGYEIFVKDFRKINEVADQIYDMDNFPLTWDAQGVRSISPNIFDWLDMQDVTRNVLIGIMVAVALINLVTCLIILVLERVRMIGVLKALGASNWTVQKIFLRHSLLITVTGILLGLGLALGIVYLQQSTGFIKLQEDAYYMREAAVKVVWWEIGVVCLGTLLVCFLVLMIPSILVRRIQPVRAIRFR